MSLTPDQVNAVIEELIKTKNFEICNSAYINRHDYMDCFVILVHNFDDKCLHLIHYYYNHGSSLINQQHEDMELTSKLIQDSISSFVRMVFESTTLGRINWVVRSDVCLKYTANRILQTLGPKSFYENQPNIDQIYYHIEQYLKQVRQKGITVNQNEARESIMQWEQMLAGA